MLVSSSVLGLQYGMLSTKMSRTSDSNGKHCELLLLAGYCHRYFERVLSSSPMRNTSHQYPCLL